MSMKVTFQYPGNYNDIGKEKIITKICANAAKHIQLPNHIVIKFKDLGHHVYAETVLHPSVRNRIVLNIQLSVKDLIRPLVHELLHLNQITTGRLSNARNMYIWEGQKYNLSNTENMNYKDYQNLPWELDVSSKESKLIVDILNTK